MSFLKEVAKEISAGRKNVDGVERSCFFPSLPMWHIEVRTPRRPFSERHTGEAVRLICGVGHLPTGHPVLSATAAPEEAARDHGATKKLAVLLSREGWDQRGGRCPRWLLERLCRCDCG